MASIRCQSAPALSLPFFLFPFKVKAHLNSVGEIILLFPARYGCEHFPLGKVCWSVYKKRSVFIRKHRKNVECGEALVIGNNT